MILKKLQNANGVWTFETTDENDPKKNKQVCNTTQIPNDLFGLIQELNEVVYDMFPSFNVGLKSVSVSLDKDNFKKCSFEVNIFICNQMMVMKHQDAFDFKNTPVERTGDESEAQERVLEMHENRNRFYMKFLEVEKEVEGCWLSLFKAPNKSQLAMSFEEGDEDLGDYTDEALGLSEPKRKSDWTISVNNGKEVDFDKFNDALKKRAKANM
jgi:hypothetical protein